ncbi:YqaA family protein [Pseudoalteromonas 'SMAR']|uniref:YqaA family protein n=1 Tax=Pseudoalteromonas 'SMAR' TaxID=3416908 RepID=UPI003AF3034D
MVMSQRIKQKTKELVASSHVGRAIAVASFLESTIVPIPLEAVMVPLMQARREKLWHIAAFATLGCVFGAAVGYAIGYYLFDIFGTALVELVSTPEQFAEVKQQLQQQGFWFVLTLGVAPVPFQLAMLGAGAAQYSLSLFLLATVIARALRYFGLALVVYYGGDQAEKIIKQHKTKAVLALTAMMLLLWWGSAQL